MQKRTEPAWWISYPSVFLWSGPSAPNYSEGVKTNRRGRGKINGEEEEEETCE